MEARPVLIFLPVVLFLALLPGRASAYDDRLEGAPHEQINMLAIQAFQHQIMPADPLLKTASLDGAPTAGIAWDPSDGWKYLPPTVEQRRTKSLKNWIIGGGFSADEPEATTALVHFYDPKVKAGHAYLTDELFVANYVAGFNSTYENPQVDAVQWAFNPEDLGAFVQKYSWAQGKDYLRQALESPDANNADYGRAWRSLGETMHLMADMTVPAHVRNDGHASALGDPDPYESTVTGELVTANAGYDPAPLHYSQAPQALMRAVATYTNEHFLSQDTISLPPGSTPSTRRAYTLPSLDGLKPNAQGYLVDPQSGLRLARVKTLWQKLLGYQPQQPYTIDAKVVADQRRVLIPTAIKADAALISDFLPRFKVAATVAPAKDGSGYTLVGGIKGVWSRDWPEIGAVKVRNGAWIQITDAKTGDTRRLQVTHLGGALKDFDDFSYDIDAKPGDTVGLEFDLGGYVVRSSTVTVAAAESRAELTAAPPMIKNAKNGRHVSLIVTAKNIPGEVHSVDLRVDAGSGTARDYYPLIRADRTFAQTVEFVYNGISGQGTPFCDEQPPRITLLDRSSGRQLAALIVPTDACRVVVGTPVKG